MDSSAIDTREANSIDPRHGSLGRRLGRIAREIVLTAAALFGVLIAGITVTAARSGVQPLVVRSGSMEPTIATGSMVLTKQVEASTIKKGDIVTVERPDRTRVTHRVVALHPKADAVELTLKGDANTDPDPIPVVVRRAGRVIGHIPNIGRMMAWLASAQGGFLMGCVVTVYMTRVLRRRSDAPDA